MGGEEETEDELLGLYSDFFSKGLHDTDHNFVEYDTDGNPACGRTFDINTDKEDDDDDIVIQAHLSPQDKSILMAIEVELEELKGMHEKEKKGWLYSTFFS